MKKFGCTAAAVAALVLAAAAGGGMAVLPASAGAAPTYDRGAPVAGVLPEEGKAEVVREEIALRIPALPQSLMTEEDFAAYSAAFTVQYTLRNPTAEPLSLRLYFPFGARPEYLMRYDDNGRPAGYFDDAARYGVTVNGEQIAARLRTTYFPRDTEFTRVELNKLPPAREESFYTSDLKCHTHVFDVTTQNAEDRLLELTLSYNPVRTHVIFDFGAERAMTESGNLVVHFELDRTPMFLCAGDDAKILGASVVEREGYWAPADRKEVEAEIAAHGEETTFGEFVEARRTAGAEKEDWCNAAADYFCERTNEKGFLFDDLAGDDPLLDEGELLRWYDYTLEIPAGGTAQTAVSGPLYPGIWWGNAHYECLFSPAQEWASFGEFSIAVETELPYVDCAFALQPTDMGYAYAQEGLPLEDFELEIDGGGAYDRQSSQSLLWGVLGTVVLLVFGLGALGFVVVVAVLVIRALKRR